MADAVQSTGFIPGSVSKIGAFGPPRVAVAQREAFWPLWEPRTGPFRLVPVTTVLAILPQNALHGATIPRRHHFSVVNGAEGPMGGKIHS